MIDVERLQALLPVQVLSDLAESLGVNAPNQVRLPGEAVFVCLLNTLASHPVVTLRLLEETYSQIFGRPADHSSFGKRLAKLNPAYFQAIYTHLYRRLEPQCASGAGRGLRWRRVDATTVTYSAKLLHFGILQRSGNRADSPVYRHVKAVMALDEDALPQLMHLCGEPSEANDNCALGDALVKAAAPGDFFGFDAGCHDRERLLKLHRAGAFWLTPHGRQKWRVLQTVWVHPLAIPPEPAPEPAPETGVPAGVLPAWEELKAAAAAKQHPKLPAPCLLQRVEQIVFENADDARHPSWQAKWAEMPLLVLHAERSSHRLQGWVPFVLLTNLPLDPEGAHAGPFRLEALPGVYRNRWEIESFFKFLKQHLGYEHLVSFNENGIHLMVLMTLIMTLFLLWYREQTRLDRGWRSVKSRFAFDTRRWTEFLLLQAWRSVVQQPALAVGAGAA